jgi:histidine triad (HIT) family protein
MPDSECLFCKILAGEIPADIIFESESTIAFRDINPRAPTHVLIIPRQHVATINDIEPQHEELVGSLFSAAKAIASAEGLSEDGYRVVMNCNEAAGQTVFHLHLHLLGGRALTWPPG